MKIMILLEGLEIVNSEYIKLIRKEMVNSKKSSGLENQVSEPVLVYENRKRVKGPI